MGTYEEGYGPVNSKTQKGGSRKQVKPEKLTGKAKLKRYNLLIPDILFEELQQFANSEHTLPSDLIRRYIKLGLKFSEELKPGTELIIQHPGEPDRHILLII